jgi:hypothetical protein
MKGRRRCASSGWLVTRSRTPVSKGCYMLYGACRCMRPTAALALDRSINRLQGAADNRGGVCGKAACVERICPPRHPDHLAGDRDLDWLVVVVELVMMSFGRIPAFAAGISSIGGTTLIRPS